MTFTFLWAFSVLFGMTATADTSYNYFQYNSDGGWEDSADVTMFSPSPLQSRVWHFPCTLTAPQWADNASRHPSLHCKPKCTYSNCHPCKCKLVAISMLCWVLNSDVFQLILCIFLFCQLFFFLPDGLFRTLLASSCDISDLNHNHKLPKRSLKVVTENSHYYVGFDVFSLI